MKCPRCNKGESIVTDSRSTEDNCKIRRRRECVSCSHRFTTYENMEDEKDKYTMKLKELKKIINQLIKT